MTGIHKSGIRMNNIKEKFGDFIRPIFNYFKNYLDNNEMNNIYNIDLGKNSI